MFGIVLISGFILPFCGPSADRKRHCHFRNRAVFGILKSVFITFMAKKGSILICDDEEIMREVLETLLSSAGYRVDLAKTGEEALEIYSQRSFDVVLMDVSMPGMGGLTALEELIKLDAEAVVLMI